MRLPDFDLKWRSYLVATLMKIEFPWPIADIVLQHRECFDGSGFPRGLKGEGTLIEAKILVVTNALEDLTSHLANRNALKRWPS